MTVTKMDHAMLSFAFLGNLAIPARRPASAPAAKPSKDAKRASK